MVLTHQWLLQVLLMRQPATSVSLVNHFRLLFQRPVVPRQMGPLLPLILMIFRYMAQQLNVNLAKQQISQSHSSHPMQGEDNLLEHFASERERKVIEVTLVVGC